MEILASPYKPEEHGLSKSQRVHWKEKKSNYSITKAGKALNPMKHWNDN